MTWAKAKLKPVIYNITNCFYTYFQFHLGLHPHHGSRLHQDKIARFRFNVSISVQPRLTFLSFYLPFLQLPQSFPPLLFPTYYI